MSSIWLIVTKIQFSFFFGDTCILCGVIFSEWTWFHLNTSNEDRISKRLKMVQIIAKQAINISAQVLLRKNPTPEMRKRNGLLSRIWLFPINFSNRLIENSESNALELKTSQSIFENDWSDSKLPKPADTDLTKKEPDFFSNFLPT